jgi:hypothetical protein
MTAVRRWAGSDSGRPDPVGRLAGWLADGTPHFVPVGQVLTDGDHVCCHLCGHWFLSVASHLRVHGWAKSDYLVAFELERANSLAGESTRKRRAAALVGRRITEPSIRNAQRAARDRARSGELAAAAAAAATGRTHPLQRRAKTLSALAGVDPNAQAEGTRRSAQARVEATAAAIACRFGFADFDSYAADRLTAGFSLAELSREAGVHADWARRHVGRLAPDVAAVQRPSASRRSDGRWRPVLERFAQPDVPSLLRIWHIDQHRTVNAIADATGFSRESVEGALRRHGITRTVHADKRHTAVMRDEAVAARFGYTSLADYVRARRTQGLTWKAIAGECALPESTLRRRA